MKTEARWSHVATTKEYLGPPEPGRGKGGLSLTASGQWRLADALILNFWLLELSENEFLLFLGHLKLYQVGVQFLSICGALVLGPLMVTKIYECSSSLYKLV